MATVLLRNINPLGQVDVPLLGREEGPNLDTLGVHGVGCLEPGEEFEVDEAVAGYAPHWRPVTDADPAAWLRDLNTREVDGPPDVDGQPTTVLEVFDPGAGLLAQVGNYELVPAKKKRGTDAGTAGSSDTKVD